MTNDKVTYYITLAVTLDRSSTEPPLTPPQRWDWDTIVVAADSAKVIAYAEPPPASWAE